MSTDVPTIPAAQDLSRQIDPRRVLVSGSAYDESLRIWNGAAVQRPLLVVRCQTAAEVQSTLLASRRHRLPVSVRGGGHDWAGRALRPGGLVIDLSTMRRVSVDPETMLATVEGGASASDVMRAAAPHELSAVTGTVGKVGITGLTLGGGYGPVNGRFGLALDNLVGAEVVLADGRLVTADATHEPELYWALRGGGGNFGVVTSMRIRLHALHWLLAGFILYPWSQARDVLSQLGTWIKTAPDELTVQTGIVSGPDGSPTLMASPAWSGNLSDGQAAIDSLQRLGSPLVSQVHKMTYSDMLSLWDPFVVDGRGYAIRTRSVAAYTPDMISALLEAGSTRTSPLSGIYVHHFHGAAARVRIESTAFGIRRPHFAIEIVPSWEPDDKEGARHRAWADVLSSALAPSALPGGYAGLLGPEALDQIAHAYGPNSTRLMAAKARFDPDGIFSAISLPSARPA